MYFALFILAPTPRSPYESEKTYITTTPSGSISSPKPLSCWHDSWLAYKKKCQAAGDFEKYVGAIDDAEVEMSVVIPAYNEEKRLEGMLEEAVGYLEATYSRSGAQEAKGETLNISNGNIKAQRRNRNATPKESGSGGYEILLVNDGSKDKTVQVALDFSQRHNLHDIMRIITLKENRGKGGAVTHGFRHARGAYVVFADADGASRFTDLGKLVAGCKEVEDGPSRYGRGVAVGSRAHLVGSEAVVKVIPSAAQEPASNAMLTSTALRTPQRTYAILSYAPQDLHSTSDFSHPRHTVWFQAVLAWLSALHYPLHARRRLDL